MESLPTLEQVSAILRYNAETGDFIWRKTRGGTAWAGTKAGAIDANGYVNIRVYRRLIKAHRLAWLFVHGVWPPRDIDHANRNKSDNRIANLRLANDAQNVANATVRRDNRSGFKGVRKSHNRFVARITKNGKRSVIGSYGTAEAAHAAYLHEAKQFYGEFARSA